MCEQNVEQEYAKHAVNLTEKKKNVQRCRCFEFIVSQIKMGLKSFFCLLAE